MEHYTLFLLSEPKHGGCNRLAEILGDISHDSVNRFLLRERYEPKDLFEQVKTIINLSGGILSVDDTVIEKLYSQTKYAELIGYFWSGKSVITPATPAKWSVSDYHRMIEAGILSERRVELIDGEIWEMPPEGPLHTSTNINAVKYLRSLLNGLAEVREAHPITLITSEPEPDVAIVRLPDTSYLTCHPQPNDIYWLI